MSAIRLCDCDPTRGMHDWGSRATCRRVDAAQIAYQALRRRDPTGSEGLLREDAQAVIDALDEAQLIRRDRTTIGDQQ